MRRVDSGVSRSFRHGLADSLHRLPVLACLAQDLGKQELGVGSLDTRFTKRDTGFRDEIVAERHGRGEISGFCKGFKSRTRIEPSLGARQGRAEDERPGEHPRARSRRHRFLRLNGSITLR